MIKVFASENRFNVQQIKDLLEAKGIECFIKNEYAIGGVGELSPFDAWPEVWLKDEEWLERAQQFINQFLRQSEQSHDWFCSKCGEKNEASFEICWQCGTEHNQDG